MIITKTASLADLNKIVGLHVRSWRENYTHSLSVEFLLSNEVELDCSATWNKRLNQPSDDQFIAVAEVDGQFAGFACACLDKHPELGSLVDNLHVEPAFRRQGVGVCLMSCIADWMNERRHYDPVYLEVYAENVRGQKFYDELGGLFTTDEPFAVSTADGGQTQSFHIAWDVPDLLLQATVDRIMDCSIDFGNKRPSFDI